MSDPSTLSMAHKALAPTWAKIRTIMAGVTAVREAARRQGGYAITRMDSDGHLYRAEALGSQRGYLPQYEQEGNAEYIRRLYAAPWRPEFEDAVRGLSAKPFSKSVTLMGDPSPAMKALAEDIDGAGHSLHEFGRAVFTDAVAMGACGIFVDYPATDPGATLADERASGARPYFLAIEADRILALHTARRGSREVVTHLRFREVVTKVVGFEERQVERVRVYEPGRWQVWTKGESGWAMEEGPMTLPEVPFVLFTTGKRTGDQHVLPPLADLAEMQLELFRALSRQEEILTYAGSPMLAAPGDAPGDGSKIQLGPKTVLFRAGNAETAGSGWSYVQPDAANLREVREHIESVITDMRRLGMQPLLPRSGDVSATASALEGARAHSSVQAWALGLKDALEQAFVFAGQWLGSNEQPEVSVHTDFAVGLYGEAEIMELRESRKQREISRRTYWDEMTRRGVLGPQFDPDEEAARLEDEEPVMFDDEAALGGS